MTTATAEALRETVLAAHADATAWGAEDAAIARARAVLDQAETGTWPEEAKAAITAAARVLQEAIDRHSALRARDLDWEDYDTDLREYAEGSRHGIAVEMSAEDAEQGAAYLAELIDRTVLAGTEGGQ